MSNRPRVRATVLACLVAALSLAAPALAGRHNGRSGPAFSGTTAAEPSGWLDRTWSWLFSLFGEDNGHITP